MTPPATQTASRECRTLGLVVARGGSKGVPGKNLRMLAGHPLVAHAVRTSRMSPSITRTVISTEDPEIAGVAKEYGADVPFMRPAHLASDEAKILDTVVYTLTQLARQGDIFDVIALIQPTTPFRCSSDIEGCLHLLRTDESADSAVALTEVFDGHPARLRRIRASKNDACPGRVHQFLASGGDSEGQQRQDVGFEGRGSAYRRTGACYTARCSTILDKGSFYGDEVAPWLMPAWRSVNIDEELDFLLARAMLEDESYSERLAFVRERFSDAVASGGRAA